MHFLFYCLLLKLTAIQKTNLKPPYYSDSLSLFCKLHRALIEVMPKIVFLGFTAGSLYNGHVLYYPSLKFSQYMPACYGKPKKKTVRLKTGGRRSAR